MLTLLLAAEETTKLVYELQKIAHDAGHPVPLLVGVDQENGGVNSLFDEIYIRQYPSAMGMAATGSKSLVHEVAVATAQELKAARSDTKHAKSKMDPAEPSTANHETKIQVSRLFDNPATFT